MSNPDEINLISSTQNVVDLQSTNQTSEDLKVWLGDFVINLQVSIEKEIELTSVLEELNG